jgi:hypothetical protein
MAIGFLLSRFLKSSASTPRHSSSDAMSNVSTRRGRRNTGAQDWSWSGGSSMGSTGPGSAGSGIGSSGMGGAGMSGSSSGSTTDALGGSTLGTNPGRVA